MAGLLIMVITTESFACKQSLHLPYPTTAKPYFNHTRLTQKASFSVLFATAEFVKSLSLWQ